jgi:geranylgeranyl diphosphate synthase type II
VDAAEHLANTAPKVNQALEEALPKAKDLSRDVVDAMRYSLFSGGKRLRPALCLAAAAAVGGEEHRAMPAAVAIEMIHTSSLIHDDLPAMDDDDTRRGQPASHKVHGEGMAVLAGDGLLVEGLTVLPRAALTGQLNPKLALAAHDVIAQAAGWRGMVGGQAVDLSAEGRDVDESLVAFIHGHKTAALISASVAAGAILGGGNADQIRALSEYGRLIGLAFQIRDDILDMEGDATELGKPTGSDERRAKATYPRAVGQEKAKQKGCRLIKDALAALADFGPQAKPLRAIAEYLLERTK